MQLHMTQTQLSQTQLAKTHLAKTQKISAHEIQLEDDVLVVRLFGFFTESDLVEFYALAKELGKGRELYCLADTTHAAGITPGARRQAVLHSGELRIAATACFGLSSSLRVMLLMLVRAAQLVGRAPSDLKLFFTAAEVAARAALATERTRRHLIK